VKPPYDASTTPSLADHAAVWFRPPLGLLTAIIAAFAAHWFAPIAFPLADTPFALGPVIVVLSLFLFIWAARTMRSNGASLPPNSPTTVVVSQGPYNFSRNPIYLSMLLLQLGLSLWGNSLWFLIAAGIFAGLLFWGVVRKEEDYLERKFGGEYRTYRNRVRRWI
jgi:protein-S-isoprenylcysteine O-methyltransferase Ste14